MTWNELKFAPDGTLKYQFGVSLKIRTWGLGYNLLGSFLEPKLERDKDGYQYSHPKPTFYVSTFHMDRVIQLIPELGPVLKENFGTERNPADTWTKPVLSSKLFDFQTKGVEWLLENRGGLLCDEMGLGKTAQSLQFLENSPYKYSLVIAPASVIFNWEKEIKEWAPSWTPLVVERGESLRHIQCLRYNKICLIVSWGLVPKNAYQLHAYMRHSGEALIIDEAHYAKGFKSKRTQAVCALARLAKSVVLLTGTPMRNVALDLFPLLHMVNPKEFSDFTNFSNKYSPGVPQSYNSGTFLVYRTSQNVPELRTKVAPHMLFRKKINVLPQLPPKRYRRIDLAVTAGLESEWQGIRDTLQHSPEDLRPEELIHHRIRVGEEKANQLMWWMEEHTSLDHPAVVFLVHRRTRAALEVNLKKRKIKYGCLVGDTSPKERQRLVDQFQAGKLQILICSEAGKEGITLTRASQLVQLERFWTPADESQAEGRIWRIGQQNKVIITHMHMKKTIDDFIAGKLARKRKVIEELFDDVYFDPELLAIMEQLMGEKS